MIAKSIGQAFNVAYQEFLRQNGLSDEVVEEAEYNGVLEAQKILGEDLSLLADENSAKEVSVVVVFHPPPQGHLLRSVEFTWPFKGALPRTFLCVLVRTARILDKIPFANIKLLLEQRENN